MEKVSRRPSQSSSSGKASAAPEGAKPGRKGAWLGDITHLVGDVVGLVSGIREEAQSNLRARTSRVARKMELVTRAEFEICRAMIAKARDEQEQLKERVQVLEAKLAGTGKRSAARRMTSAVSSKSSRKK